MAAYPRLTDGEQLAGHGVPDGLQVKNVSGEMYLMTFRPDGAADQRTRGFLPRELLPLFFSKTFWCA
jgi:hypothetical protein